MLLYPIEQTAAARWVCTSTCCNNQMMKDTSFTFICYARLTECERVKNPFLGKEQKWKHNNDLFTTLREANMHLEQTQHKHSLNSNL